MELKLRVLVTDVSVRVVQDDSESLREALYESFRWEKAKIAELRDVSIDIPLLVVAPSEAVSLTEMKLDISDEVKEMVEKVKNEQKSYFRDVSWELLMDALTPGTYVVEKSPGMRGMRRIK